MLGNSDQPSGKSGKIPEDERRGEQGSLLDLMSSVAREQSVASDSGAGLDDGPEAGSLLSDIREAEKQRDEARERRRAQHAAAQERARARAAQLATAAQRPPVAVGADATRSRGPQETGTKANHEGTQLDLLERKLEGLKRQYSALVAAENRPRTETAANTTAQKPKDGDNSAAVTPRHAPSAAASPGRAPENEPHVAGQPDQRAAVADPAGGEARMAPERAARAGHTAAARQHAEPPTSDDLYDTYEPASSAAAPFEVRETRPVSRGMPGVGTMISHLFRHWKPIAVAGFAGAAIAYGIAKSIPNEYLAQARVLIEPRGLRVLDNTVAPQGLNSEATIAFVQTQAEIMRSRPVFERVIDNLNLVDDPEFNGQSPVRIFGFEIPFLQVDGDDIDRRSNVMKSLYEQVYAIRNQQSFYIEIGAISEEPEKSARIANAIAYAYVNGEAGAQSGAAERASEGLKARLDVLGRDVLKAEEAIQAYKAENGLVDTNGRLIDDDQLERLNNQLAAASAQSIEARTEAEQARRASLTDAISGSLPAALNSNTISQLRVRFADAKSRRDRVAIKLGPRHPDRIAAESEVRSAREAIAGEIQRLVASAQREARRAEAREAELRQAVEKLRANSVVSDKAKVRLRELERDLAAKNSVYQQFLLRSRETGEQSNIVVDGSRVEEAVPPDEKHGPNRKLMTAIGGILGGSIASLLALIPLFMASFSGGMRSEENGFSTDPGPGGGPAGKGFPGDDLYTSQESFERYTAEAPPMVSDLPPYAGSAMPDTQPSPEPRQYRIPRPSMKPAVGPRASDAETAAASTTAGPSFHAASPEKPAQAEATAPPQPAPQPPQQYTMQYPQFAPPPVMPYGYAPAPMPVPMMMPQYFPAPPAMVYQPYQPAPSAQPAPPPQGEKKAG